MALATGNAGSVVEWLHSLVGQRADALGESGNGGDSAPMEWQQAAGGRSIEAEKSHTHIHTPTQIPWAHSSARVLPLGRRHALAPHRRGP